MKKSYLFGLCAASMLLMTSCQKDGFFGSIWQDNQEPVTVKMNVSLPDMKSATRATKEFGNGYSADYLNYAVYEIITKVDEKVLDANGKPVTKEVRVFLDAQEVRDDNMNNQLSKTIALKLMTGSTYEVVFWAQHHKSNDATAPYQCNFNKVVGEDVIAEVTLDYDKIWCNQEDCDAFYNTKRIENVTLDGGSVIDLGEVKLYRPFAQLNIGTADFDAATAAGFPIEKVSVSIPDGVYDVINLCTGEATHSNENEQERVFKQEVVVPAEYTFPYAAYEDNNGEKKPLRYLAMNYLLAKVDKETLNTVTLNYYSGGREKSRTFSNVPVQRNWRTNIYGDLLTSDVAVKVTIAPAFIDNYNENRDSEK